MAAASAGLEVAREALHQAVHEALDGGGTWSEVAQVLGVSRQGAFQQFARKKAPSPDEGLELTKACGVPTANVVNFDNIHTIARETFRRRVTSLCAGRMAEPCRVLQAAVGF